MVIIIRKYFGFNRISFLKDRKINIQIPDYNENGFYIVNFCLTKILSKVIAEYQILSSKNFEGIFKSSFEENSCIIFINRFIDIISKQNITYITI